MLALVQLGQLHAARTLLEEIRSLGLFEFKYHELGSEVRLALGDIEQAWEHDAWTIATYADRTYMPNEEVAVRRAAILGARGDSAAEADWADRFLVAFAASDSPLLAAVGAYLGLRVPEIARSPELTERALRALELARALRAPSWDGTWHAAYLVFAEAYAARLAGRPALEEWAAGVERAKRFGAYRRPSTAARAGGRAPPGRGPRHREGAAGVGLGGRAGDGGGMVRAASRGSGYAEPGAAAGGGGGGRAAAPVDCPGTRGAGAADRRRDGPRDRGHPRRSAREPPASTWATSWPSSTSRTGARRPPWPATSVELPQPVGGGADQDHRPGAVRPPAHGERRILLVGHQHQDRPDARCDERGLKGCIDAGTSLFGESCPGDGRESAQC